MIARLASSALAAAALCAIVSGCSTPAEPVEPNPVFTSEEQAFAAAEETYRAYVDALNAVDLSDPETFEDVFAWTTGEANAAERESLSAMHADGFVVSGTAKVVEVTPDGASIANPGRVVIAACTDVTDVEVRDATGASIVASDRPPVQAVSVQLVESPGSPTGLLISVLEGGTHQC